ncbi:MAG TPA: BON domain-containing protein [Actinocrinis sp.]|nr:BON domain-containing protein [Actinocrinis sp.]
MNPSLVADDEIRRRVIDRVIDVGGEVLGIEVEHGAVRLRGRVGEAGQRALVSELILKVDGVESVVAALALLGEAGKGMTRR